MAPFKQRGPDRRCGTRRGSKRRRVDRVEEREQEVRKVAEKSDAVDETDTKVMTTRVPEGLAEWVEKQAKVDGRSASGWIRKLISDARDGVAPRSQDPRLRLKHGVELRDGRIVSAHLEKGHADSELEAWAIYGPMVVDLS